jgi:hypothetical protein
MEKLPRRKFLDRLRIPVEVVRRFHGKRSRILFEVVLDSVVKRSAFWFSAESWTTWRNRGPHGTELRTASTGIAAHMEWNRCGRVRPKQAALVIPR